MDLGDYRVQVHPGSGVVAVRDGRILFVQPDTARHQLALTSVLSLALSEEVGAPRGRQLASALARLVVSAAPEDLPDLALVTARASGPTVVFVHGDIDVEVDDGRSRKVLRPRDEATWLTCDVADPPVRIVITPRGFPVPRDVRHDDLHEGVVPGGGLTAHLRPVRKVEATQQVAALPSGPDEVAPVPQPDDVVVVEPQEVPVAERERAHLAGSEGVPVPEHEEVPVAEEVPVSRSEQEPWPGRERLPARTSKRRPTAVPQPVAPLEAAPAQTDVAPHPPHEELTSRAVGVLVLDDGATFVLDDDYVIGRGPELHPDVHEGRARGLVLEDQRFLISRVHATLRLRDGHVEVTDEGSANGTRVAEDGGYFTRLQPHQPLRLRDGARLLLGERVFTLDLRPAD